MKISALAGVHVCAGERRLEKTCCKIFYLQVFKDSWTLGNLSPARMFYALVFCSDYAFSNLFLKGS